MQTAVNRLIVANPGMALEITGGLVAAGVAGVTLRQIMRHIGLDEKALPEGGMAEVELLDEHAPGGFFAEAVENVHASLVGYEMRGAVLPKVGWFHGLWRVKNRGVAWMSDPGFDTEAQAFELVDIVTPAMDKKGELV
jgi:hypothetical protein